MPMYCISIQNIPAVWIPDPNDQNYEYWFINSDIHPPTRQPITLAAIKHHGIVIAPEHTHIDTQWTPELRMNIFSYNRIPWVFDIPLIQKKTQLPVQQPQPSNTQPPDETITQPPDETITSSEETVTIPPDETVTQPPDETITLSEEAVTLSEEAVTLSEEAVTIPDETVTPPEETQKLCTHILDKLAGINERLEEYNKVQDVLKDYISKGFNVEASLQDLDLQKSYVSSLESKVNVKLREICDMFD